MVMGTMWGNWLPAATKLGQGNIFTSVCLSTGGGRGVCLSACWDASPGADTPLDQAPPQSRHPSPDQAHTPLDQAHPPDQVPPHPPDQAHPPGLGTPWTRHTIPQDQAHPSPPQKQTAAYG